MVTPAFSNALFVAGMGPMPMRVQSTPATARETISPRIVSPFSFAKDSLVMSRADAPNEKGLLVAAVTEPPSTKAGFKLLIFSTSGIRGPSSFDTVVSPSTLMGITSLS